jgi:hypothetical protein
MRNKARSLPIYPFKTDHFNNTDYISGIAILLEGRYLQEVPNPHYSPTPRFQASCKQNHTSTVPYYYL